MVVTELSFDGIAEKLMSGMALTEEEEIALRFYTGQDIDAAARQPDYLAWLDNLEADREGR